MEIQGLAIWAHGCLYPGGDSLDLPVCAGGWTDRFGAGMDGLFPGFYPKRNLCSVCGGPAHNLGGPFSLLRRAYFGCGILLRIDCRIPIDFPPALPPDDEQGAGLPLRKLQRVDKVVLRGQGEDKKDSPRTPGADEQRESLSRQCAKPPVLMGVKAGLLS